MRSRSKCDFTDMRQYDDLVTGEMNVRLDGMRAYIDGGTECAKRVFWIRCLVASVGNRLWQLDATVEP
jgi:hypothetical protein